MNQAAGTEETWRSFLGRLIEKPAEKQRAAEALGVSTLTLTRWVSGESDPHVRNLRRLPAVFPQYKQHLADLIRQEYDPGFATGGLPYVPPEFVARLLSAVASTSGPFFSWSLCSLVLRQALDQLDADLLGMEITLAQCVPPVLGNPIRSLCERIGAGTAPWPVGVSKRLLMVGAESLSGYVVGKGEPAIIQNMDQEGGIFLPTRDGTLEKSVACYPLLRRGRAAGCLRISSTQYYFFTTERLALVEQYTNLAAQAFGDEEFYRLRQIALAEMPPQEIQQQEERVTHFRNKVLLLRRQEEYRLTETEAETRLLQEIEAHFLSCTSSHESMEPSR
ncbi:MAG TPA: GAF domain-containing protein [Ktedonobacteraceae bacterium]|nr:GAF domain-containing protein [Ktedonobacteraceae bacterium]